MIPIFSRYHDLQTLPIDDKKAAKLNVCAAFVANLRHYWLMYWLPDQDSNLGPAD